MATVYYIGDSTVAFNKYATFPQQGMSNALPMFLKDGVAMSPHGRNGRSTKSFLDEGAFAEVAQRMGPGDFLLIQFGHNDEKEDPARHTDPDTTFRENLRIFIRTARACGAYPALITPIARRLFDDKGKFRPGSHGPYPQAIREVGAETGTPVVDMTALTEAFLEKLGDEPSKPLFVWPVDNTHLKYDGAAALTAMLCRGLWDLGAPWTEILEIPE